MSYSADQLLKIVANYEQLATDSLVVTAKKKEKKKLDPKAKVRNRGTVCVPAEQAKDKKDHFPINDADQARNALARVHQYDKAPDWYKGSLKGLQALVARKVKAKYPKIDVGGKKKEKKSYEMIEEMLSAYAQVGEGVSPAGGAVRPQLVDEFNNVVQDGPAVQQYQQKLKEAGEDCPVNGTWDQKCQAALISYQRKNSISTNEHGRLGKQTRTKLLQWKRSSLEYIDSLLAAYGQTGPLYGEMSEYELAQLAQKGEEHPGIGTLSGEPFLANLLRNGKITQRQYEAAKSTLSIMSTPATRTPTPTAPQTQAPAGSKYPRIDSVYQTMLGVNPDGSLGPITQAALDRYKVSVGNPGISNELAYEYLKRETEYSSRRPMDYDDNSNTYVTNRQKQQAAPGLVRETPF